MCRSYVIFSAIVVAGISMLSGCNKNSRVASCSSDKDCVGMTEGVNGYCVMNQCQECVSDAHCGDNRKCMQNRCATNCVADNDCSENTYCSNNGVCSADCDSMRGCVEGHMCARGRCISENSTKCSTTADCESGFSCESGFCINKYAGMPGCSQLSMVNFGFDRSDITPEFRSTLESVAQCLKQNNSVNVRTEGHADERGTAEYNLALGDRRAREVNNYLSKLGVAKERTKSMSYGMEKPLVNEHTEDAYAKNRRAEVVLEGG